MGIGCKGVILHISREFPRESGGMGLGKHTKQGKPSTFQGLGK